MNAPPPQPVPKAAVQGEAVSQPVRPAQAVWRVDLLGGLRLNDGAQSLVRMPSRATACLLARLALAPERAHAREELIELLWPGVALDVGRNRLRQALSSLKSILEPASRVPAQPVLRADRSHVRVVRDALVCDAALFEQHLRAGRPEEARALYRGEFMPGHYDEWVDEERLRLAALHERLPALQAPRAHPPAQAAPKPGEERAPSARIALPHYLGRMFGADEQGAALRSLVLGKRLVTLVGPGGAGKTRLAVEVAHSLREHAAWPLPASEPFEPFDLLAFVPLASCTTHTQALDALTRALQIAPGTADAQLALVTALTGRRALLVLDNFEQLVGQAEGLVAALLAQSPALHMVVTSRRALAIEGEHEFAVETLQLPAPASTLADAAISPAVALFVECARAVRADFHLGPRNVAAVVNLVRALEGMPLAIELAASRVRSIAPADMLERLRGPGTPHLDLLQRSGARSATDLRHASMQRAIAWSVEQLDASQGRLLAALTMFAGGFTAAAAAAIAGAEGFDTSLLLDDLVAHSLVHRQAGGDEWRFGLYQPIREFAASRLDAAEARGWRAQLRAWARRWVRELPATPPLPALHAEMPNLLAAMSSAVGDASPDDAVVLLLDLGRCLEDIGLPAEGILLARAAVDNCADAPLKARGHSLLGQLLFTAGHGTEGLRHVELGMQQAGPGGLDRARALHALARVRWRSRRHADEVEPLLEEAGRLAGVGDEDIGLKASLLALRAFVTNVQHKDFAQAEQLHAGALALWERQGNQHAVNSGRYNLAVCAQNAGRHAQSLQRLEPVVASAREQQDWRRLSQSLNVSGNAHCGLRDWPRALADYQDCIRTAWDSMSSYDLAFGLWNLPRALAHLRQPELGVELMACAAGFWQARFGPLTVQDWRDVERIRRLASRGLAVERVEALWKEGERLTLSQAVARALASTAAA